MLPNSDMDARDRAFGIPESELLAAQAEADRVARWAEFVDDIKPFVWTMPLCMPIFLERAMAASRSEVMPAEGSVAGIILAFKDGQEWSDVLSALARAFRDVEQERERLLTQG